MKPPVHAWKPEFLSLELDGGYPKKSNERRHFHEQENPGQIDPEIGRVGHVAECNRQTPPYLEAFHQRRAGHRHGKKHFFR